MLNIALIMRYNHDGHHDGDDGDGDSDGEREREKVTERKRREREKEEYNGGMGERGEEREESPSYEVNS